MIYNLEPGYIYISHTGTVIRTVVGNCISVCLWDGEQRIGGMNHYLYPVSPSNANATPRYGNCAILMLIRMMLGAGCEKNGLKAQIYGGARKSAHEEDCIGVQNVAVAREFLQKEKITILSEDTGGFLGRKIMFDTNSGKILVLKVYELRNSDWIEAEK